MSHFEKLKQNPEKHNIYQAFRILEAHFASAPRFGESLRSKEDPVRIEQEAELAFPPSSINALETSVDHKVKIVNRVFGLFGPEGPLPLHITEFARDRKRNNRDSTFYSFVNSLTHRLTGLLYRSWRTGQPAIDFDRGRGGEFEERVAALTGLRGKSFTDCDAFPDLGKLYFTGHLGSKSKNSAGLEDMLSSFFRVPVKVEQFVGSWLQLEKDDHWHLGSRIGLGDDTILGEYIWSNSAKFRIHVGPVSLADYKRFLPDSKSIEKLKSIVRNYIGDTLDWDVKLVLKADDVPTIGLGVANTNLGHTVWLGRRDKCFDAGDLYLNPVF